MKQVIIKNTAFSVGFKMDNQSIMEVPTWNEGPEIITVYTDLTDTLNSGEEVEVTLFNSAGDKYEFIASVTQINNSESVLEVRSNVVLTLLGE